MNILPLAGTDAATHWDSLYNFLVGLSIFFFVLVIGAMVYFTIRYRARPGQRAKYITGNHTLEIAWTAIPTLLVLILFAWGYSVYNEMTRSPSNANEVRVIARQWSFTFQYDDGRTTMNELYVPLDKPTRLIMTSEDVLHSFFIPGFRIKQDIVPGMYTSLWFEPTRPGKHQVFCTEYCGAGHSGMSAHVNVLTTEEWQEWKRGRKLLAEAPEEESGAAAGPVLTGIAAQGRRVARTQGCTQCHSEDGTRLTGPSFKGLYGTTVDLANGSRALVDENYIRQAIMDPMSQLVPGYPVGAMTTYRGRIGTTEMNALVAYVKSLK